MGGRRHVPSPQTCCCPYSELRCGFAGHWFQPPQVNIQMVCSLSSLALSLKTSPTGNICLLMQSREIPYFPQWLYWPAGGMKAAKLWQSCKIRGVNIESQPGLWISEHLGGTSLGLCNTGEITQSSAQACTSLSDNIFWKLTGIGLFKGSHAKKNASLKLPAVCVY